MATISNNLLLYFLTLIKLNKLMLLISLACQCFCFVAAGLPESSNGCICLLSERNKIVVRIGT